MQFDEAERSPVIPYASPSTDPPLRSLAPTKGRLFAIGTIAGDVTLVFRHGVDAILFLTVIFGVFGFAMWFALVAIDYRNRKFPTNRIRRFFGPVLGFVGFPAAYFVYCRLGGLPGSGERFAERHSPFAALIAWTIFIVVVTFAGWNRRAFGTRQGDWVAAGFVGALIFAGEMFGMNYLSYSISGSLDSEISLYAQMPVAMLAWPAVIALTFSPIAVFAATENLISD